jgi:alpha-tubulin suppressor-like RCC1 family protein
MSSGVSVPRAAALLLAVAAVVLATAPTAWAKVRVTPADATFAVGDAAELAGPILDEGDAGDIGVGTLTIEAPAGFEFDTTRTVQALVGNSGSCTERTALLIGEFPSTAATIFPQSTRIELRIARPTRGRCLGTIHFSGIVVRAFLEGVGLLTRGGTSEISGLKPGAVLGTLVATPAGARAWAWGSNVYGELGRGYSGSSGSEPEAVAGLTGVTAVAAGDYNTFAVLEDGSVWGWGLNSARSLGAATTAYEVHEPVRAEAVSGVIDVAAGYAHTLALRSDGTVWSWGGNGDGQLGDGTTENRSPQPVPGLTGIVAIAAGREHSLALDSVGTVWAWGGNTHGQLLTGTFVRELAPVAVLNDATAIAAGDYHSLALKTDGTVWGGGLNGFGQLGTGAQSPDLPSPVQARGISGATAIGTGDLSSFAITADGRTWGFGYNQHGQLGTGTAEEAQPSPTEVRLAGVTSVAGGEYHTLFLLADGSVWASGSNYWGALGVGYDVSESTSTPVRSHIQNVTDVAAQESHSTAATG